MVSEPFYGNPATFWPLCGHFMVTLWSFYGHFWPLFGHFWPLCDHFGHFMLIFWPLCGHSGQFWPLCGHFYGHVIVFMLIFEKYTHIFDKSPPVILGFKINP